MLTTLSRQQTAETNNRSLNLRKQNQTALNSFLVAAEALVRGRLFIEAEIRYLDALRVAEKNFGKESDQVMLVASILASFYRAQNRDTDALEIEGRLVTWEMLVSADSEIEQSKTSFVSSHGSDRLSADERGIRAPSSLRRACQMLGLSMEESLTVSGINRAWKKQMLSNGAHPDLGGNTDEAILLNKAKEELIAFLDERAPKLGARFKKTVS